MKNFGRILASALVLAALLSAVLSGAAASAATVEAGFQSQVAFSKLTEPTNFEFAPDGRLFVAQKNGEIKVFPAGSGPTTTPETFADLRKPVYDFHDRGLLGLELDPQFAEGEPYVYALYTFDHELGKPFTGADYPRWGEASKNFEGEDCKDPEFGCVVSGRLVRLRVAPGTNHAAPSVSEPAEEVLVEDWCQQYPSHSVGDLQFGPEGALFAGGGDGAAYENFTDWGQAQFKNPCGDPPEGIDPVSKLQLAEGGSLRSQSVLRPNGQVTLDGTIIRIDPDTGKAWPGNPFAASSSENAQRIVAFGFRNPFRFTIDPASNELFVANVGNVHHEEIDRFPIGATTAYNSGWPCYEGDEVNLAFETYKLAACERLYKTPGSTSAPFFSYDHAAPVAGDTCPRNFGSAVSGSVFYEGGSYPPEYDGAFFFADSVRQCIFVMPANAGGEPDPSRASLFLSESGEYQYPGVDIELGPGGDLYYAGLGTGAIYRIAYDEESPVPAVKADKEWGSVTPSGLAVEFDASASTVLPGHTPKYEWDLDGDGQFDDGSGQPVEGWTYTDGTKNVEVAVRVKDQSNGKSAVARKTIYPGDEPPEVNITSPLLTETWGVGQSIHFAGTATAVGGKGAALPSTDLFWQSRLLHCPFDPSHCHEHPLQAIRGIAAGDLTAPNHEYPSYVNFVLTATDARGLSAKASVKIAARPVALRIESSPPGVPITIDSRTEATPFDYLAVEGAPTTLAAPSEAEVGGVRYAFKGWSDSASRVRTVSATSPRTYLAEYAPVNPDPGGGGDGGDGGGDGGGGGAAQAGTGAGGAQSGTGGGQSGTGGGGGTSRPAFLATPKLTTRPPKQTTSRVAKFAFPTAGAPRFQCRLDRGKFGFSHSPLTYRKLKPGKHTFRVRAAAADGTPLSKATVYSWRILSP